MSTMDLQASALGVVAHAWIVGQGSLSVHMYDGAQTPNVPGASLAVPT
jgi:hypothetical protein